MKTWFFLEREPKNGLKRLEEHQGDKQGIIDTAAAKRSKTSYNNKSHDFAVQKKLIGFLNFNDENKLRAGRRTNLGRSGGSSIIIL